MPVENIDPEEHAALLYKISRLPYEKAKQLEDALQHYMQQYLGLWAEIDGILKKYKETAKKIKERDEH
jgi:hypothetical protein